MNKKIFIALFCSFSLASPSPDALSQIVISPLTPTQRDKIKELSDSTYWHRLMHYRRSAPFFKIKSEVDGKDFFFSADGKYSPENEMIATSEAFFKNREVGKLKQHPQCAFPVRYRFLKKELDLKVEDVPCPRLEKELQALNPKSVALVFSSSYTGNPGSMFGHTFFRIDSGTDPIKKRADLLEWGIGFAAVVPPETGGLEFAFRGIFGGFPSQFSMLPYYAKVNEYINAESRDLWEYKLSLSEEETLRLVEHIWEIESNSYFEYYFFDENCAYQLLTALEVAKPEWNLSHFGPHVIPGETIKRMLSVPGAVVDIKYRPSLKRKAMERYALLSEEEKEDFKKIINKNLDPETEKSPLVLESVSTYLQFEKQKNEGKLTDSDRELLTKSLITRSKLGVIDKEKLLAGPIQQSFVNTRPEIGHHPYLLSASSGVSGFGEQNITYGYFQEIYFKFAYHDLLNNDEGFGLYSHIDFPNIALRYYTNEKRFTVDKVNFIQITSLNPISLFEQKMSFAFQVKYYEPKDLQCRNCGALQTEGGGGFSLPLGSERNILYSLLGAHVEVGGGTDSKVRGGPKGTLGLLLNPWKPYKTQFLGEAIFDLFQDSRQNIFFNAEWNQSYYFSQSWEIRSAIRAIFPTKEDAMHYNEARLLLNYYF